MSDKKSLIYNGVFSAYTQIIGTIINKALEKGGIAWSDIEEKSSQLGFEDTYQNIKNFVKKSTLFKKNKDSGNFEYNLQKPFYRPITNVEKQWIKTMMQDPRFNLFDVDFADLSAFENVEPLFDIHDVYYYDQRKNGDSFTDSGYLKNFREIVKAIENGKNLYVCFNNSEGRKIDGIYNPKKIEYSLKEDKMRLKCLERKSGKDLYINLSRIQEVKIQEPIKIDDALDLQNEACENNKMKAVLYVTDENDVVERILLHFSHLERETIREDEKHFTITLFYDKSDEREMVIRIMSFGPNVEITDESSPDLVRRFYAKIEKQKQLFTFP